MSLHGTVVFPGTRIGRATDVEHGTGTYLDERDVYSSTCGVLEFGSATSKGKSVAVKPAPSSIPVQDDIVFARVTRINKRMCTVDILQVGNEPLRFPFQGSILAQHVRSTDIGKVLMSECFLPGDIIKAQVLSLGTMREYALMTAKDDLGVVLAVSQSGSPMEALGPDSMRCPDTGAVEKRKVAKPAS